MDYQLILVTVTVTQGILQLLNTSVSNLNAKRASFDISEQHEEGTPRGTAASMKSYICDEDDEELDLASAHSRADSSSPNPLYDPVNLSSCLLGILCLIIA